MFRSSLSLLLLSLLGLRPAWAEDRPNIMLVIWDTTRADHLSIHGHERDTTPNLARISGDAAVFDQACTTGFWTLPSVAGIMTGMFGHNHQVDYTPFKTKGEYSLSLNPGLLTLPEKMQELGYRTASFNASKIITKNESFSQGYDVAGFSGETEIVKEAVQFIDESGEQPWFVLVYYLSPHAPYKTEEKYHIYARDDVDPINIRGCNDSKEWPEGWLSHCDINYGRIELTEDQWDQLRRLYDQEIYRQDDRLGQLWARFEERGISDDIFFIFTSDHGEAFNDHEREKAWHERPYDNNQLVPLVLRWPGHIPATRVSSMVRTIDLYPTIIEAGGGTVDHQINGLSLFETLDGTAPDRPNLGFSHRGIQYYRDPQHKILYNRRSAEEPFFNLEVYDLVADPGEQENLAGSRPELVEEVKLKMKSFVDDQRIESPAGTTVDDEQIELLESLGYVGD